MKNLVLFTIAICMYFNLHAQLNDCPGPATSPELIDEIPVDFIPGEYTDDIWGAPVFDDAVPEDRLIIWVHGLSGQGDDAGGTEISWLKASTQTESDYYVNSRRPDYNDASLFDAAAELKGDIEIEYGSDVDENTFIIAHSQGGIVCRRIDEMYETGELGFEPRTFHGLVTFGSPHQGAMIINDIPDIMNWINEGCDDLSEGPIAEFESLTLTGLILSLFIDFEDFSDYFCYDFLDILTARLSENLTAPIASDYQFNAPEIVALNEFTPTIPYVAFYGTETEPQLWKTLVHMLDGHLPNDFEPFDATDDETLVNDINQVMNYYDSKIQEWKELENINDALQKNMTAWLLPFNWDDLITSYIEEDLAADLKDAYEVGYSWLVNANINWLNFIGAETLVWTDAWCQCVLDDGPLEDEIIVELEDGVECVMPGYDCNTVEGYISEVVPNDGIVIAASAGNVNGLTASYNLVGSNHFSMRNDANTKIALEKLFQGEFGEFFTTQLR